MKKKKKITPAAPKDVRDLKRSIQRFKDDINEHRDDIWYEADLYTDVKDDDLYKKLEEESDLTKGDIDLDLRANLFQRHFDEEHGEKEKPKLPPASQQKEETDAISAEDVEDDDVAIYLGDEVLGETDTGTLDLSEELTKKYAQYKGNALAASKNAKKEPSPEKKRQEILEKYRKDFELQLGEGLLSKLGLIFLLIGIIWLVNYGIGVGFINRWGRILISLAAAVGLLVLSHYQRNISKVFSAAAAGVGIFMAYYTGLLYFDFFLNQDGFIPFGEQLIAFSINLIVTAVAVVQALSYSRRTIAAFGMLGGYLTPIFVSVADTNDYLFFGYLLLVNIGFLVVSYHKNWSIINLLTFAASIFIFGGWVLSTDMNLGDNTFVALLFGTLYYVTFLFMNIAHSLRNNSALESANFFLLLINTFFYAIIALKVLFQIDADAFYFSFFSFALTLFNYLYAYILYKNNSKDFKLLNTVIFISVFGATVGAPLLLEGADLLNVLWSIEAVILLYIGLYARLSMVKSLSVFVLGLAFLAMLIQWYLSYNHAWVQFLENTAVLTALTMLAAIALIWVRLRYEDGEAPFGIFTVDMFRDVLIAIFLAILLLIVNLELIIHSSSNFGSAHLRNILINGWHIAFVAILWAVRKYLGLANIERTIFIFFVLVLLSYFGLVFPSSIDLREAYVRGLEYAERGILVPEENALRNFLLHYINLGLILFGLVLTVRIIRKRSGEDSVEFSYVTYLAGFIFFLSASIEYWHLFDLFQYNLPPEIYDSRRKVGFIVVWLLTFLSFISLGIQTHIKELRLMALFVFGFTITKFLLVDFWLMNTLGRIISFLVMGGILITVALLYSQLRKLIIKGELDELRKAVLREEAEEDV